VRRGPPADREKLPGDPPTTADRSKIVEGQGSRSNSDEEAVKQGQEVWRLERQWGLQIKKWVARAATVGGVEMECRPERPGLL